MIYILRNITNITKDEKIYDFSTIFHHPDSPVSVTQLDVALIRRVFNGLHIRLKNFSLIG